MRADIGQNTGKCSDFKEVMQWHRDMMFSVLLRS